MSEENSVEVTAPTVEEAIAQGLAQLGVSPAEVIVEVLEEPSKGVLGIGAHPARVRLELLTRKPAATTVTTVTSISQPPVEATPIVLPISQPPPQSQSSSNYSSYIYVY